MTATKSELEERLAALEEQNAALRQQLETQAERAASEPAEAGSGGYLIETPNKEYTGTTAGVNFVNGVGLLDGDRENSEMIAQRLVGDFGYSVLPLSATEMSQARKALSMQQPIPRNLGMKLSRSGAYGGG